MKTDFASIATAVAMVFALALLRAPVAWFVSNRWLKLSSGFGRVLLAEGAVIATMAIPVLVVLAVRMAADGFRLPPAEAQVAKAKMACRENQPLQSRPSHGREPAHRMRG